MVYTIPPRRARAGCDDGWPERGVPVLSVAAHVPSGIIGRVRHTEFWRRMEAALGPAYARSWADQHVLSALGGRTVAQAIDSGEDVREVWRAVWAELDLPPRDR